MKILVGWAYRLWLPALTGLLLILSGCTSQLMLSQQTYHGGEIIVWLPDEGSQWHKEGAAVWDGIQAAKDAQKRLTNGAKLPALTRMSSSKSERVLSTPDVDRTFSLVIGPIEKAQVDKIARYSLPIPVLALNRSDTINTYLYQFALEPTVDSQTIAKVSDDSGCKSVVILRPSGKWGDLLTQNLTEILGARVKA
ncbi:MAG: hypothetical protein GY934_14870, partial [Gammaproteobacteria bacterium]|nr:hypothetical protein [Gammaproteobacteria bacterium]